MTVILVKFYLIKSCTKTVAHEPQKTTALISQRRTMYTRKLSRRTECKLCRSTERASTGAETSHHEGAITEQMSIVVPGRLAVSATNDVRQRSAPKLQRQLLTQHPTVIRDPTLSGLRLPQLPGPRPTTARSGRTR
jgi:hypothetical protein